VFGERPDVALDGGDGTVTDAPVQRCGAVTQGLDQCLAATALACRVFNA
jgi:hypothetical protein